MLSDSLGQEWISYLMNEFLYKQINSILKASLQTGIEWKRLLWGHMSALPCTMYLMTSISWVKGNFLGPRISRNDFNFSFHTITSVQCVSHTKSQSSTLWDFLSLFAPSKVIGTKEIPLHTQTMALYGHESQQFTALILSTLFLSTLIGFSKLCHPVLSLWQWSLRLPALSFKDPLLPLFSIFILSLRSVLVSLSRLISPLLAWHVLHHTLRFCVRQPCESVIVMKWIVRQTAWIILYRHQSEATAPQ